MTALQESLRTLCMAAGAGGLQDAAEKAAELLRPLVDEVSVDPLGNVIGFKRCAVQDAPTILLEAHIDEIGVVVTGIDDQGFVHVAPCGGVDARTLAAAEVTFWADKPYKGVFCSTPPHLSHGDTEVAAVTDRGVDIGLEAKKARKRIPLGTRGTFLAHYEELAGRRVCAKALDDRAGVAAILEALRRVQNTPLSCHVAVVFAVQEELGCRGAAVAAFTTAPACAIVTDVSFASTPDSPPEKCGKLGDGPMLGWAPGLDYALTKALEKLALRENIKIQHEVMGGETGTDADAVSSAREGIPSALLSIPLRYMHTPSEVVQLDDVAAVGALMAAFLKEGGEKQ